MKLVFTSLKLAVLTYFLLSCKKEEVSSVPKVDYLSSACKLSSFTSPYYSRDIKISTVYNSQNQLSELVAKELVHITADFNRRMLYENGQLKKVIKNFEDYPELSPVPLKNQIATEYEYGKYGVEKIHNYESGGNGSHEKEYFEFKYADGPKPIGMSYFMNMSYTEDKFILGFRSTFEYDDNGNLAKEIIENIGGLGGTHDSKIKMYFFDDKINTVKKLNYIYFDNQSPALVLSTNNVVKVKWIYPSNEYEQPVDVKYDGNGNALWAPIGFSKVVWDCQ
jgi:hypothetical protein